MARFVRNSNSTFKMGNIKEILKELDFEEKNIEKLCYEMVEAAAKNVYKKIVDNMPPALKKSKFMKCVTYSKPYKTTAGSIGCLVMIIDGYFINHKGKRVPAPLVANLIEFGRHDGKYPKKKFFYNNFKENEIEKAMNEIILKRMPGFFE